MMFSNQKEELARLVAEGRLDLVKGKLIEHSNSKLGKDYKGCSPFQIAVDEHIPIVVQALLPKFKHEVNQTYTNDNIPLIEAALRNDKELVQILLAVDTIQVNIKDENSSTALRWACSIGANLDIIEALIAKGADVNLADMLGETPLIAAAARGRLDLVQALVRHGADVFIHASEKRDNETALMAAKANDEDGLWQDAQIKEVIAYLTQVEKERRPQSNNPERYQQREDSKCCCVLF